MSNSIKLILGIIVAAFLFGVIFRFLFRVGVLLLIGLGVLYLFRKVFTQRT